MDKINIEYLNQKIIDSNLIKKSNLIKTDKYAMGAITTRGTNPERPHNEDYSAIMTYPLNDDLVMLIMADGKDNSANGRIAARELVRALSNWFLSKGMSQSYINIPVLLEGSLLGELRRINRELYVDKGIGDASFALAVIGKEDTLIANVGNVRCYSINENTIDLKTTDDLLWYLYNNPELINPDQVKYLVGKDYLSRTIGKDDNIRCHFEPYISIVRNTEYNSLLITSHGVNDVLDSDELLKYVNENNVEDAMINIINASIYGEPKHYPKDLALKLKNKENMLIKQTVPGDSNASAVLYKKFL